MVAAAGNLDHDGLVADVERAFQFPDQPARMSRRTHAFKVLGRLEILPRKVNQIHVSLGSLAYPYADPRKYALLILNTVLGDGMSSRLFQNVREKRGLAYTVQSYLALASDTGLFNIYAATEPSKARDAIRAVLQELNHLRNEGLQPKELSHCKEQLKGRLMLGLESMSARMVRLAQQEILLNAPVSLDETRSLIDAVSNEQVGAIAEELFDPRRFSMVVIGPVKDGQFSTDELRA